MIINTINFYEIFTNNILQLRANESLEKVCKVPCWKFQFQTIAYSIILQIEPHFTDELSENPERINL